MPPEPLRLAAFCAYLASWLVLAAAAFLGARPRVSPQGAKYRLSLPAVAGTVLQAASILGITLSMGGTPLRPGTFELAGALALAPLSAAMFVWTLRSATPNQGAQALVTGGAYQWVRHPMYLAFFAMLLATGLLASSGLKLALAAALYLAGSEIRIRGEEADLTNRFPAGYPEYCLGTPWRYLPGVR